MSNTIIFVHGWSVTSLDTYGELPLRLAAEAQKRGVAVEIKEIFLGRYISFSDQVTLQDISKAFDKALSELTGVTQFTCITHSTGGPVVRDWLTRFKNRQSYRLSHLIMLAPANFGSALAQLGKSRVSRLSNWLSDLEPGQQVLDWLELGSASAWKLNENWIRHGAAEMSDLGYFPFVLTGQSIDRKLYDHLNSYTGELGSDGVVRVASANLNSRYIRIEQQIVRDGDGHATVTGALRTTEFVESPQIPFRLISGKSHSGDDKGIMASVSSDTRRNKELVQAIFECMAVDNLDKLEALRIKFDAETEAIHKLEQVEVDKGFLTERKFIHDHFSQIIFRVVDSEGQPVTDYDLLFTAGDHSDPNMLPEGFSKDRQQNRKRPDTVTYYFNYDIMTGVPVRDDEEVLRAKDDMKEIKKLGLIVDPRPVEGFVRYARCSIEAKPELLRQVLHADSTTLIEIVVQRIVSTEVFRLVPNNGKKMPTGKVASFKDVEPGSGVIN